MALSNNTNKVTVGIEVETGNSRAEIEAFGSGLARTLKEAQKDSDATFNSLTQLRIGLTQLGRGDVGGIPNLIKFFKILKNDSDDLKSTFHALDASLLHSGATSTTAKNLFEDFGHGVKTAISGTGQEAELLKKDFATIGISLEKALVQPDQAFRSLLKNFSQTKSGSSEAGAAMNILGVGTGNVATGAQRAGAAIEGMNTGISSTALIGGAAAVGLVAAIAAIAAAIITTVKLTEGMIDTAGKVGTKSKDDFDEFSKAVKASGNTVTETDRALSQQLLKTLESVKAAADSLFIVLIQEAGPALIVMLQDLVKLLNDLQPAAHVVGQVLSWAFNVGSGAIAGFRELIRLVREDLAGILIDPVFVTIARLAGRFAGGFAAAKTESANFKPPPPTFDSKRGKRGGGGGGEKDLSDHKLRIAELEAEAKDAQHIYELSTAQLKAELAQRFLTQEEYARKAIELEQDLVASKLAVLKAETREAETVKLPNKRTAELLKIEEKEKQLRIDFGVAIQKINEDQIDSEAKDDAAFAAAKKKGFEQEEKAIKDHEAFLLSSKRRIQDINLEKKRLELDLADTFIGTQQESIKKRTSLEQYANFLAHERQVEDNKARIAELEKQTGLETDEEKRRNTEIQRLRDENSALDAESDAKSKLIQRRGRLDQERAQPNSNLNLFGSEVNDAINKQLDLDAALERQSSYWDLVAAGLEGYLKKLKSELPSAYQLAIQSFVAMGAAMTQNISAYVTGQKTLRQAIGGIVDAMLEPYKKYCEIKAAMQFAEAAGDFVVGNFAGGAAHLAVGVLWSGLAGLIGAAGGLIGGGASKGAAGAADSNSANNQNNGPRIINQDTKVGGNQLIIRVEPGIIVDHVTADYKNNGILRQLVQSDKK